MGPLGELLEPMGTLSFEKAYDVFREMVVLGERYGADIAVIEDHDGSLRGKGSHAGCKGKLRDASYGVHDIRRKRKDVYRGQP